MAVPLPDRRPFRTALSVLLAALCVGAAPAAPPGPPVPAGLTADVRGPHVMLFQGIVRADGWGEDFIFTPASGASDDRTMTAHGGIPLVDAWTQSGGVAFFNTTPDWVLRTQVLTPDSSSGDFYLDPAHPEVRAWNRALVRRLLGYGFDGFNVRVLLERVMAPRPGDPAGALRGSGSRSGDNADGRGSPRSSAGDHLDGGDWRGWLAVENPHRLGPAGSLLRGDQGRFRARGPRDGEIQVR